MNNLIN